MNGKFTAPARALPSAVKFAAKWVEAKPNVPIYGGLMFRVARGSLTIAGMNENVTARASVPVEGDADGAFVVAGRLIDQLAATFADKPVTFEQHDSIVTVTCGSWRGTLPAMSEDDYPTLPQQAMLAGTVDGQTLADAVHRIAGATARNSDRGAAFMGLHVSFDDETPEGVAAGDGAGSLTMTATDGYRATRQSIAWTPDPDGAPIGESALPLAASIADAVDGFVGLDPVAIGYDAGSRGAVLSLTTPARSIVVRTLGDPFPDTRGFFAAQPVHVATVRRADLILPLKRAGVLDSGDYPTVTLRFSPDLISLAAGMAERGDGEDEVEGVTYDGPEFSIVLQSALFTAAISSAPGDSVTLGLTPSTGKPKPVIIISDADPTWRHILMPIRKN